LAADEIDELHPAKSGPARIDAPRAGVPNRRWRIALLLGIGVLVNYFDRVNLSVSSQSLVAAFGISDVVFGFLSSAYNWTYAACQLPIGVILDKFGVRRVGRVGTFLWSVASFGAAVTPSLNGLFGARFLLGIGEAPTFPSNAKAIGMWFPERERGLSTALFDGAAKFASAIGVPLIGAFLLFAGWRWSFALTGAISFFYFLYFSRVYRDPEEDTSLSEAERQYIQQDHSSPAQSAPAFASPAPASTAPASPAIAASAKQPPSSLAHLLSQRKVLGLTLGMGAYNYVFYLLLTWLPRYLATSLHVELLHSFIYTSVPWLVATFTDVAIGGWLIDHLISRGRDANRVRRIVLIAGTAFGLGIFGAAHAHDTASALFWISMSIGGLSAASPVLWATPALIVHRNDVGKVGGIANFAGQISGISAPIITGYLVSALHSYFWVFGVAAIYLAIGIAGYFVLLGRIEMPSAS
jgi:ACS family D-galactonate transporter-like MFS transporter